jgi:hypothetical protein
MIMKPELVQQLEKARQEHLAQLVQELIARHPVLEAEMATILERLSGKMDIPETGHDASEGILSEKAGEEESTPPEEEEVTDEWDFSGGDPDQPSSVLRPFHSPRFMPLNRDNSDLSRQFEEYARLWQSIQSPDALRESLTRLTEEATLWDAQGDSVSAMALHALLFDERLLEQNPDLTPIYDSTIDAAIYFLGDLLEEASSEALIEASGAALSPLLSTEARHRWLERLFAVWLKRLDAHRIEEDLPELLLNIAWGEDLPLLRNLTQHELQKFPRGDHSNVVDFSAQFRIRALEKFLRELPHM